MRGLNSLTWLVVLVVVAAVAQWAPPWETVDDPEDRSRPGWTIPYVSRAGVRNETHEQGHADESRKPADAASLHARCETCNGSGYVTCPVCGGSGETDEITRTECDQCGGTGVYRARMGGGGGGVCPFCRGTGQQERRQRVHCETCGGHRYTPCPSCKGTGTVSAEP